ncbi:MAG: hypothetical protein WA485_12055 [Candidatus Sulfotelmatobacter sp.]
MSRISPTAEGFRAAFRRPSFTLAEITWRWVFGTTATVLILFGFFEYLDTLPVSYGEMLLLKTNQPFLVWQALMHILHGSLARAVLSLALAALLLSLVWIVSASVGRVTTLRAMLDYVRERINGKMAAAGVERAPDTKSASDVPARRAIGALARLSFLRVALALATILGCMGASIVAGFGSSAANPSPGVVFLLFMPIALLVGLTWFALNWLLSLTAVFVVRDGKDGADAIAAAVALCRERTGAVLAVSTWTGFAHLVAFVGATMLISVPLGLAGFLPWRLVALAILVLTLAYFAVADWIYTARLAGYLAIVETPEEWLKPAPPIMPVPPAGPPLQTTIDRDEPILSDVPGLILET